MRCTWCDTESEKITEDHVIPRAIGGTRDFVIPACDACQSAISRAEAEVARKSILAIHSLASPLAARHPERPSSGLLRPSYLLVKHPYGGYGESILRAGERMEALPHFEIKVVLGEAIEGRVRGPSPDAAQRLLDTFRATLRNKPAEDGAVCSITADLDLDTAISADPDFWPRIVLLPGDRLLLRARNPEELTRFAQAFTFLATSEYQVNVASWQNGAVIKGGTPHLMALKYDPQTIRRVAAKIAYGLFTIISCQSLDKEQDTYLRQYILGLIESENEPVSVAPWPEKIETSERPHYVVLSPTYDREAAIVCLYGFKFRVELGPTARCLPNPIVVFCQVDGTGMSIATSDEAGLTLADASKTSFSQPWKSDAAR